MSRSDNGGPMARGRTKVSHKCFGVQGSQISYILHNKVEGCNIGSHSHRQPDSHVMRIGVSKTRSSL